MAELLTEEEQIEALKQWWKKNGQTLVIILALGLFLFWGWNYYNDAQVAKAAKGSATYDDFLTLTETLGDEPSDDQSFQLDQLAASLKEANASGFYSGFAELYLAKLAQDQGDSEKAIAVLESLVAITQDAAISELARLRLGRLMTESGEAERALEMLSANVSSSYVAAFSEAKGDTLVSLGRLEAANDAYQKALDSLAPTMFMRRNLVQLKLDNTKVYAAADIIEMSPHTEDSKAPMNATKEAGDA